MKKHLYTVGAMALLAVYFYINYLSDNLLLMGTATLVMVGVVYVVLYILIGDFVTEKEPERPVVSDAPKYNPPLPHVVSDDTRRKQTWQ